MKIKAHFVMKVFKIVQNLDSLVFGYRRNQDRGILPKSLSYHLVLLASQRWWLTVKSEPNQTKQGFWVMSELYDKTPPMLASALIGI